jgi:succinate dehydrogenase / fumarate reductase cytochrome b subunit
MSGQRSVEASSQMSIRDMAASKRRTPVFFNLMQIQMPVGALTSITHRVTGIFLALCVPFSVYLLDLSLQGPQSYELVISLFDKLAFRGAAIVFVWVLAHHVLAGFRHLLSDVDIGSQLPAARRSAWVVNLGGIAVALLAAGALL